MARTHTIDWGGQILAAETLMLAKVAAASSPAPSRRSAAASGQCAVMHRSKHATSCVNLVAPKDLPLQ
eukprot:3875505-Pyramimonas_sp.AAC.1